MEIILIFVAAAALLLGALWWKREWALQLARRNKRFRRWSDRAAARAVIQQQDELPPEARRAVSQITRGRSEEESARLLEEAGKLAEAGRVQEAAQKLREKPHTESRGRQRTKKKSQNRQRRKAAKKARRRSR